MLFRRFAFLCSLLACVSAQAATEFKIATLAPEGTAWMREMRTAGDAIRTRTDERVRFRFYPGGVMGSDATVLRKIRVGQLQGGAFSGSELAALYPDVILYGLPFLFNDQAEVDAVRARLDPIIAEGLAGKGMIVAGISGGGFAYLLSTRPIREREDLVRAKPWLPSGDFVSEAVYRAAGVNPVPLSIADVYTGLQTGLVDTVANTPSGTLAFQWHTRVRHLVDMPIAYITGILALDKRSFDRLSAEDQAIVMEEVRSGIARLDVQTGRDNDAAREALRGEGIEFFQPNAEERAYWRSMGRQAADSLMRNESFSRESYDLLTDTLRELRGE